MAGRLIHQYQLLEKLGAGGMGEIFKATDTRLNRFVAIKVLAPAMSADPERRKRFFQEAQAASALNHPNIITIYDIVSDGDTQCMVMEFIPGKTLREMIPAKGMAVQQMLQYASQMAGALSAAHAAGIMHRDLKPSNVMVTPTGLVKILDFGLAKYMDPGLGGSQPTASEALTREGSIVGTVSYMSPEQAEGKHVDARTDIFSFGSVMYEMVTGRRAFEGTSGISTLTAILRDDVKPIYETAPEVPPLLEQVIIRCLPKDPEARWRSMKEVEAALVSLQKQYDSTATTQTQPPPLVMTSSAGAASAAPPPLAGGPPPPPLPQLTSVNVAGPIVPPAGGPPSLPPQPAAATKPPAAQPPPAGPPKKSSSKAAALIFGLLGLLLIAGAGVGGWWWWTHQGKPAQQPTAQVAAPAQPPAQATEPPPAAPADATPATPPADQAAAPPPDTAAPAKGPAPASKSAKRTGPATKQTSAAAPKAAAPETTPRPAPEEPPPPPPKRAGAPRAPVVQLVPVSVGDALPFRIALAEDVPMDAQEGQALRFTVLDGLAIDNNVVIAKGATVSGSIIGEAGKKKFLGMGGKMTFRLLMADGVDGKKLNVRATAGRRKDGPTVRPFDTGKNPKSKGLAAMQGTEYIAYVDGEQSVSVKK